MLTLILYEIRSRWGYFLSISSLFLLWDILLSVGFGKIEILFHTLLFISLIGFVVFFIIANTVFFHLDFMNQNAFFIHTTPSKVWKIILSKLLPIWFVYIIMTFIHSIFMVFSYLSMAVLENVHVSLVSYCFQLFKMNVFLFFLMNVSLLFFWVGVLEVKSLIQNSKAVFVSILTILVLGGLLLAFLFQYLLINGMTAQNLLTWTFSWIYLVMVIPFVILSLFLFRIIWVLLKTSIDL